MKKRKEYAEKVKAQIDRWNREVDELEAEVEKVADGTRAEIRQDLDAARAKRDELLGDLGRLKDVAEDAWEETTTEIDLAWGGIQNALKRAADRIKSKQAQS